MNDSSQLRGQDLVDAAVIVGLVSQQQDGMHNSDTQLTAALLTGYGQMAVDGANSQSMQLVT